MATEDWVMLSPSVSFGWACVCRKLQFERFILNKTNPFSICRIGCLFHDYLRLVLFLFSTWNKPVSGINSNKSDDALVKYDFPPFTFDVKRFDN